VCHRLKPYLSATPAKSAETEQTRSSSTHTQSRSQTGAPTGLHHTSFLWTKNRDSRKEEDAKMKEKVIGNDQKP